MKQTYPLIFGHRGCMGEGYPPENTLAAFKLCLDAGADGIELDIHASSDGVLIVHHDTTLERMTDSTLIIAEHTADAIREHKVDGEIIPTLEETFELITPYLIENPDFILNIELKSEDTAHALYRFLDQHMGQNNCSYHNIIVSSFDHGLLKEIYKQNDAIPIGVLFEEAETNSVDEIINRLEYTPFSIHPPYQLCTADYLRQLQEYPIRCIPWAVDYDQEHNPRNVDLFLKEIDLLNFYGLITDFPDSYALIRQNLLSAS